MRADHVNAFLTPSVRVIQKMAGVGVRLGPVRRLSQVCLDGNLSILIGLQGRLCGSVILTAHRDVARALAERIVGGDLGSEACSEVKAVLAEVANTIVGNATGHLYDLGIREGITPPTVVEGSSVSLGFGEGVESVLLPLDTDVGRLDMIVSIARESP